MHLKSDWYEFVSDGEYFRWLSGKSLISEQGKVNTSVFVLLTKWHIFINKSTCFSRDLTCNTSYAVYIMKNAKYPHKFTCGFRFDQGSARSFGTTFAQTFVMFRCSCTICLTVSLSTISTIIWSILWTFSSVLDLHGHTPCSSSSISSRPSQNNSCYSNTCAHYMHSSPYGIQSRFVQFHQNFKLMHTSSDA